jgi:hypothetical protein
MNAITTEEHEKQLSNFARKLGVTLVYPQRGYEAGCIGVKSPTTTYYVQRVDDWPSRVRSRLIWLAEKPSL